MSRAEVYRHPSPLALEKGGCLKVPEIAYHTYGALNARRDNVVWVCHALTANSEVADWWPHTVEKGCFLDPEKWFVVCANILGSHYGSTGPLSVNPDTGEPYYGSFPQLTIRDMAEAHRILANHLGINRIHALVGSSVGGFQALQWVAMEPNRFDNLILIATDAKASPWTIAIDETQRMAIEADPTYGEPRPDAGMAGMAAARAIGLLTYRGAPGYNATQQDLPEQGGKITERRKRRPCTYQQYQGEKLCQRYNAYSYMTILDAFDTHDIGRGIGTTAEALATINARTVVIGISSDLIFTVPEMRRLASLIPGATYEEIDSDFGHDGFLVEHERLNQILVPFINQHRQ